jgi:hypothetical protein
MTSETTTRRVFRVFSAWHDDRKEAWLSEMARQGWHLQRARFISYTFERGEARDIVYKLDYRPLKKRDRDEYEGLFRAAGWEHVCECSSWHYFRTPAIAGASPDIFSDTESRVAKYKRLLTLFIVLIPVLNIGFMNLRRTPRPEESSWQFTAHNLGLVGYAVLALVWTYMIIRLCRRIWVLRHPKEG